LSKCGDEAVEGDRRSRRWALAPERKAEEAAWSPWTRPTACWAGSTRPISSARRRGGGARTRWEDADKASRLVRKAFDGRSACTLCSRESLRSSPAYSRLRATRQRQRADTADQGGAGGDPHNVSRRQSRSAPSSILRRRDPGTARADARVV